MKLREYEGKALFEKYGIPVPASQLVEALIPDAAAYPCVLKAQTLSGDRFKHGGIIIVESKAIFAGALKDLLGSTVGGEIVEKVLIEEKIPAAIEYYASFSYSTDERAPVLSLSAAGGSGIKKAHIAAIDMTIGVNAFFVRNALVEAKFRVADLSPMTELVMKLWKLFTDEYALLAEINPIFRLDDGRLVAGDAKIILDDEKLKPTERRLLQMNGDIAILASGGGASLLNMDTLLAAGGRPANYTEYSGNPPAEAVAELTKKVLQRPGLKGCWVIGGTANFTDIYETLRGFLEGLRQVTPKPTYPIVIRRDGPRKDEAFAMLEAAGRAEGYDFHCFDSHTPMSKTAKVMVQQAYKRS